MKKNDAQGKKKDKKISSGGDGDKMLGWENGGLEKLLVSQKERTEPVALKSMSMPRRAGRRP